jgi:hypothetical protein
MGNEFSELRGCLHVAALCRQIEAAGIAVEQTYSFARLEEAAAQADGKPEISEPFSRRYFDTVEDDAICIIGRDAATDRIVHTQALRRDRLGERTLFAHWKEQLRRIYADPAPAAQLGKNHCPAARDIRGDVVYHGDLWLDPAFRGKGASEALTRLGQALGFMRWNPDYIYAFVSEALIMKGVTLRQGYMHFQPIANDWQRPPDHIKPTDWLAWNGRADLRYQLALDPPGSSR